MMLIITQVTVRLIAKTTTTTTMKQLNSNQRKHGMMMPIRKSMILMMLRKRKAESPEIENSSDDFWRLCRKKIRTAKFMHPVLLL